MHFLSVRPPGESAGGQHDSVVRPSVWPVPPALPPYLGASEGTDLRGTDSLGFWS